MINSRRFKKGSGLVEALIVLGLIAVTIISAMSLVVSSLVNVRNNENQDLVNGILLKAIEILKSPTNVYIADFPIQANNTTTYFRLFQRPGDDRYVIQRTTPQSGITTCDANSNYRYVSESTLPTNVDFVCLQISVYPGLNANGRTYAIGTRIVYNIQGQTYIRNLNTVRYDDFQTI